MSLNKVMIIGNLGKDPDLKGTVCKLNIATSSKRKNADGEWTEETEWHRVTTFGKVAENCAKFLAKGRTVYVEGRLKTSKYTDKEGVEKYSTDILADKVDFLSGGKSADEGEKKTYPVTEDGHADFSDEEIPF